MSVLSAAGRAAVLKALADEVTAAYKQARGDGDEQLRHLHLEAGADRLEVRVPGVTQPVARLSLVPAKPSAAVCEEALLAWCRTRYPDEVQTVEQVRASFRQALLERLVIDEDGVVSDPVTGERIDWLRPVPAGPGHTTMTFTRTGREAIADAYRTGALSLPEVLALTGQSPPGAAEEAT